MSTRSMPALVAAVCTCLVISLPAAAQAQAGSGEAYVPPRTPDGQPDLQGVWQALNTAAWDIQDHPASAGVPAGQGVVVGNEIPYQEWALAQKREKLREPPDRGIRKHSATCRACRGSPTCRIRSRSCSSPTAY